MRRLVAGLAFLSSLTAFFIVVGGGLVLLAVESSGERGTGALIALSGTIAFAAAMALVFAGHGVFARAFSRSGARALAVTAGLLGALPAASIAAAALRFSGLPFGSASPLLDWPIFAGGVLLALGALSVLTLGYWRYKAALPVAATAVQASGPTHASKGPDAAPQQQDIPPAKATQQKASGASTLSLRPLPGPGEAYNNGIDDDGDDVRVTPVLDLPSIAQFRRR